MQLSSLPARIAAIFAASAPPTSKNVIPLTQAGTTQPGQASFDVGFPAVTMQPAASGGINPYGQDFNGAFNAITAVQQWQSAGGNFTYDSAFSSTVGGYPKGAILLSASSDTLWLNLADNNTTNPDTGTPTTWAAISAYGLTAITGMTNANVTLTPAQYGKNIITLAGTLTGNVQVIFPALRQQWVVANKTTGAFSVTCKTASGTGAAVPQSGVMQFYGDGTDLVAIGGITPSWQDVKASRAIGTNYTNTTGRVITASATVAGAVANSTVFISWTVGGVTNIAGSGSITGAAPGNTSLGSTVIVPPGSTYQLVVTQGTMTLWNELR